MSIKLHFSAGLKRNSCHVIKRQPVNRLPVWKLGTKVRNR